ncbi:hypothetical protein MUK42_37080 [Musa troglodytarum]|nr:hypothetical protein MUK42_37080 [Musa troglodytarum]URD76213.1 hypothetical protein MUK42_37080 [Musa troglodytarum]
MIFLLQSSSMGVMGMSKTMNVLMAVPPPDSFTRCQSAKYTLRLEGLSCNASHLRIDVIPA